MIRFIGESSTGKTKKLITEAAHFSNSLLVCRNPKAMERKMQAYQVGYVDCISYEEFLNKKDSLYHQSHIFFDDLEEFALVASCGHLNGYGLTVD